MLIFVFEFLSATAKIFSHKLPCDGLWVIFSGPLTTGKDMAKTTADEKKQAESKVEEKKKDTAKESEIKPLDENDIKFLKQYVRLICFIICVYWRF